MEDRLSIKQVLIMTCGMLREIGYIPIEEAERIGVPVKRAISNLDACIKANIEDEKRVAAHAAEEPEEEEEEPVGIEEIGGEENG